MKRLTFLMAGLSLSTLATTALAQDQVPATEEAFAPEDAEEGEEIVVRGSRPEGSVIGDIQPEVTLSPADIRSFGVSSVADLIAELAPQTGSGQGRGGEAAIVLLNGKRISGFSEIRDIPTEAIQRTEILPEEVALKYGYRPNQKVVNIVLRRRFQAYTGELEAGMPTAGGQFSGEVDTSFLRIRNGERLNIAAKYDHSSALFESERDLIAQSPRQPYDITGNVTSAVSGAEIDPALSALLGRPATVVGVPASAATGAPALAAFLGNANVSDLGRYRTLRPATDEVTLNAVLARTIFGNVSASFNASFSYDESDSAQGLAGVSLGLPAASPFSPFATDTLVHRYLGEFGALDQESRNIGGRLGMTMNGALADWQWTFTGSFDHATSRTLTERGADLSDFQADLNALDPLANPFAPLSEATLANRMIDRARSTSNVGDAELVFTGPLFTLPAGAATTTAKIGGTTADFSARSFRSGVSSEADLSRDDLSGQINIDLPIASRTKGVLSALGNLSANFNAGYEHLSDFGGLRTIGAGFNWSPIKPLTLIGSINKDEGAPTMQQLGNPVVTTTGVRVFDYIRGETVDIARISGGNPNLFADNRRVLKLGATLKPLASTDLTFTANYTSSRVDDPIASFPTATAAIEAAFPNRFTRDASGRLIQIDSRPINFARQDQEQVRWGINFSKQLWTPPRPPRPEGGQPGQQPDPRELARQAGQPGQGEQGQPRGERPGGADGPRRFGPGGPGGGFRGGFGGLGGRGTRLQVAVYHTVRLKEEILVYDGGPVLDLLNGDAIGSSGGQARHQVQLQAGLTHDGFGARLSGNWQSGTTVNGGVGGADALRFSDLATLNLRLFANLGQQRSLTQKIPFLRGSRLTIAVDNLFNSRLRVTDSTGTTPIGYQPAYLDPLGRTIRISFRKLLF